MLKQEYLTYDGPKNNTTSFYIGGVKIQSPCFIPEIKGHEDIEVLLRFSKALESNTPILVPSCRWLSLLSSPRYNKMDDINKIGILKLIKEHPLLFYEPPEFFRYTLSKNIITYCLKGNVQQARKFNSFLKKGSTSEALSYLPEFFKPFVERQIGSIYKDHQLEVPLDISKKNDVKSGWFDPLVEDSYGLHMAEIINDAIKMPNASVIPTVPPLMKSSERTILERINSTNALTSLLCNKMSRERDHKVSSYFHLYIDTSILDDKNEQIIAQRILENGLQNYDFCGVAITLSGYKSAAMNGKLNQIEDFIREIVNVSHSFKMPVLLLRSGWYGLNLSDAGIQAFSGLLNGNPSYVRSGPIKNQKDKFGKVPIIDSCVELNYDDVIKYLEKHGELPKVPNLPTKPDKGLFNNDLKYRINFSKPMRLIHIEEARRIRNGQLKDNRNPAKLYFERSDHQFLKN